ncbi:MAG: diaminopimelate decarboxylase [Bdellovibrionaceae bacterium]|nr:diaminopimelate decarboxylase [Pseudobdellovibrionaceae bacterium]
MSLNESSAWWEREDLSYHNGELYFAGRSVKNLAYQFGSPSFVYSFDRVKANLHRLHTCLNATDLAGRFTILFAMKANRFPPLLANLKQIQLCGIDACSPNEVELAVSCGFNPKDISFTAGSLSEKDFLTLSRYDGLFFDCDSLHSIHNWGKLKPGTEIGIRINPGMGISRASNEKLQYSGNRVTKFGIYQEQFAEALNVAKEYDLTVSKIHFHTGCGYLTPQLDYWESILESCQWFISRCKNLSRVNIGGGLGVPHTSTDKPLDLNKWASILNKHFGASQLHIEVEPGDYILKDAGLLLLGITYIEQKKDKLFLGLDAGFNIAPEPAFYNLPFQPVCLDVSNGGFTSYNIAGNINEALDIWYEDVRLPNMRDQKHLALINAGAYSSSMASNHCMRGSFKEFLLI